jgi:peptidyl-tRNA hydrolase
MKINRNNYESFFIDYLEGNLDEKLVDDFIEFIQQNPDLKEELSLFETVSIGQEEITFNKKELLYKEKYDAENEFNQAAVASLEGDISASEKTDFENYLSTHPEKQKEAKLFRLTKLQPDQSIIYSRKNKLYRQSAGRTVLLWTSRAAAVIIVALSVYVFINKSSNKIIPENQVASVEKSTDKIEISPESKEITAKIEIKEVQVQTMKKASNPLVKKVQVQSESIKNLTESNEEMSISNNLTLALISAETPTELQSLSASIFVLSPDKELVPVKVKVPEAVETDYDERLLVDVVKEKTGIGKLTFSKIGKAGLSLIANLSKEKFNYETDKEGKVTEVYFDSRLLAFSIPTKSEVKTGE